MKSKHTLIMLACCLIPMTVFSLYFVSNLQANTVLFFVMALLCPLSHLLMMKFMHGSGESHSHPVTISQKNLRVRNLPMAEKSKGR
jgi:glycine/serine hydroxymethyltransferase